MSVFGIIAHLSLLIHTEKDIQGIIANLVAKKETFPSAAEFGAVIDDAVELLASGLLGLPDAVVTQMVTALKAVKGQL